MYCPLDLEEFFDRVCVCVCDYDHTFSASSDQIFVADGQRGLLLVIVCLLTTQRQHRPLWSMDLSLVAEMLCKCTEVRKTYASLRDMSFLKFDFVIPVKIPQELSVPQRVARNCYDLEKKKDNIP